MVMQTLDIKEEMQLLKAAFISSASRICGQKRLGVEEE